MACSLKQIKADTFIAVQDLVKTKSISMAANGKISFDLTKAESYDKKSLKYVKASTKKKVEKWALSKFKDPSLVKDMVVYKGAGLQYNFPTKLEEAYKQKILIEDSRQVQVADSARAGVEYGDNYLFSPLAQQPSYEPRYEKEVKYKKELQRRMRDYLGVIETEKSQNSTNAPYLRELAKQETRIKDRLQGNKKKGITSIGEEIAALEDQTNKLPIEVYIEEIAERDFQRLEQLKDNPTLQALEEAKEIINHYQQVGTFTKDKEHLLFHEDFIFDDNGNLILPQNLYDKLTGLATRARQEKEFFAAQERSTVTGHFQEVLKVLGKDKAADNLTYKQLFPEDGLKDISWFDLFAMDISNGVFSHNGIVPQGALITLKHLVEDATAEAKADMKRIDELHELISKNEDLESSLGAMFKVVDYSKFRAKDEHGFLTEYVTQRKAVKFLRLEGQFNRENDNTIKAIERTTDNATRKVLIEGDYSRRKHWYNQNTIIIDVRKLPEFSTDDKGEFPEFQSKLVPLEEAEAYKKELIEVIGEEGYDELYADQKRKLREYKVQLDVFTAETLRASKVKLEEMSKGDAERIQKWIEKNDPFLFSERYDKDPLQGDIEKIHTIAFNHYIPRREAVNIDVNPTSGKVEIIPTGGDTGYYDSVFENEIEPNVRLKDFHEVLMRITERMYVTLPVSERNKISLHSIPVLAKNFMEILLDKKAHPSVLARIIEAAKWLYDEIRKAFGQHPQATMTQAPINPETGEPLYRVNSQFIQNNRSTISTKYAIEMARIKHALGISSRSIKAFDLFDLNKFNIEALSIIAEVMNIPNPGANRTEIITSIAQRVPEVSSFPLGSIIRNAIVDETVRDQSIDLPKILKMYALATAEYKGRVQALPILNMIKDHYTQIKSQVVNRIGEPVYNVDKTGQVRETRLENERKKAVRQFNSWFKREALGNYGSKNEIGDTRIKLRPNSKDDEVQIWERSLAIASTGKILDSGEKIVNKKLGQLISDLEDELNDEKDVAKQTLLQGKILELQEKKANLGKQFSVTSMFDALFNFVRLKGLGWNIASYVTNFLEGQIANLYIAAQEDYFPLEDLFKANHIIKGSWLKNITMDAISLEGSRKARLLMDNFLILQDATNLLQKAAAKSALVTGIQRFGPLEGTRRTEYLNQAPLMVAILMNTKIKNADGTKTSSVWDAIELYQTEVAGVNQENYRLKEEFRTTENVKNWEYADGKAYKNFKTKVGKAIVVAHGDYDKLRGNLGNEYITGKAAFFFKKWLPRQIYQRFAINQMDLESDVVDFKGRYRSHTPASATLHGAILGFGGLSLLGAGPVGLLVGSAVGFGLGHFTQTNSTMGYLRELAFSSKELFLNMIRLPLASTTGKIPKQLKWDDYKKLGLNERDVKNYRANMIELALTLAFVGLLLFTKALLWDDDDEQDDGRRQAHNFLANRIMQLSGQASMYLNPIEMTRTLGSIAPLTFFKDVGQVAFEVQDLLQGEDIIATGPNKGKSGLWRQTQKAFFPSLIRDPFNLGLENAMQQQWKPTTFDPWFYGDEKKAKQALTAARNEFRMSMEDSGASKEEAQKLAKEKFPYKDPDKTYKEMLSELGID